MKQAKLFSSVLAYCKWFHTNMHKVELQYSLIPRLLCVGGEESLVYTICASLVSPGFLVDAPTFLFHSAPAPPPRPPHSPHSTHLP